MLAVEGKRAISHPGESASPAQAVDDVHHSIARDEAENQEKNCEQHHGDYLEHRGQIPKEDVTAKECVRGVVTRVKNPVETLVSSSLTAFFQR